MIADNKKIYKGISALLICSVIFIWGVRDVYNIIAPTRSLKQAAEAALSVRKENDTVVAYGDLMQGLAFYTKQRLLTVDARGELDFGSRHEEGQGWFLSSDEFAKEWNSGKKGFVIVTKANELDKISESCSMSDVKTIAVDNGYLVLYREGR